MMNRSNIDHLIYGEAQFSFEAREIELAENCFHPIFRVLYATCKSYCRVESRMAIEITMQSIYILRI